MQDSAGKLGIGAEVDRTYTKEDQSTDDGKDDREGDRKRFARSMGERRRRCRCAVRGRLTSMNRTTHQRRKETYEGYCGVTLE